VVKLTVSGNGTFDFTIPRRDSKIAPGHKGFQIYFDPALSPKDAAARRDFTINSLMYDPREKRLLDFFGGESDLRNKILRHTSPAFTEDPLRVLRGMQFAARFDLETAPETIELCRKIKSSFGELARERVREEWFKWAEKSLRPSRGLKFLADTEWIEHFPEIKLLIGTPQEPEWHPEGDVWVHTLLVIDQARTRVDDLPRAERLTVMLGAVCHDLGKPATTAFMDGRIRSPAHEEAGVAPTTAFLDRLKVNTLDGYDARKHIVGIVAHHLTPGMWYKVRHEVGDGAFRRLAQKVDLELLARVAKSDCLGRTGYFDCSAMDWFVERARTLGVQHEPPPPLLLGRHLLALGLKPGPRIGEILKQVYERQLDGEITSLDEAIDFAKGMLG
jgi:tRNA nucleotidyltransferase (CCA-adding enzyme)